MLDTETKRRIDSCRDILVGKVPDPKSQVEQITIALIYKFMDDMDAEAEELGGRRSFFAGEYARYGWAKLLSPTLGGFEMLALYAEAISTMDTNPGVPVLFREMFKNAYLPYRDPETLRAFLKEINGFTYDHSERLGDAFEYLLSVLGSQGDAGQFRTPRHIIDFIVSVVDPQKAETILDPACGTAGFLISSYKHIQAANRQPALTADERARLARSLVGYDISPDMVRLSLVNLYLHGFPLPQIREYDTLTSDEQWGQYFDVILANPPFMSPKGGIKPHKRFSVQSSRSEVLFVDYIAEHLTPQGRAGVIVPEGIIFQSGGAYKALRKMLVNTHLVAVVSLPAGVFQPYSGVKTSVLILDRQLAKCADSVLFVKIASDGFGLGAQRRAVVTNDLPGAARQLRAWRESLRDGTPFDAAGAANVQVVPKSKIAASGEYNLNGDRYISQRLHTSAYEVVSVGDVCEINPRKSELSALSADTPVSFVPMQDVNENRISFTAMETRSLGEVSEKGYTYFRDGDVLLAKVTPCFENGKAAVADGLVNGIGFGSSEYYVLRPNELILPELLYYFVTSPRFKEMAIAKMTGTGGLQRVPRTVVADFSIPLPPLAVQQEIVAEIEGYQKVIDGARQVVENYKPRIRVRPEWPVVELGEVCKPEYGFTASAQDNGSHRFIRITDIGEDGHLKPDDAKYINLTPEAERSVLVKGDLLVARTGATYGKTMIFDGVIPSVFASYLIRLRFPQDQILPNYYWAFAQSAEYWAQAQTLVTGGGQPQFNGNALVNISFPLPDLDTQRAIVAEIEEEQRLVAASRELITRFAGKVTAAISRVWGEEAPPGGPPAPIMGSRRGQVFLRSLPFLGEGRVRAFPSGPPIIGG